MNADRIANSYRWLEYAAFGLALEHARFDFLSHAVEARSVLILGEGDGRFLARLLEYDRQASITVMETSPRMIDLAQRRLQAADQGRVKFYQVDAVTCVLPDGQFDLVVAHFFFDVLDSRDAQTVITKVSAVLSPGAVGWLANFKNLLRGVDDCTLVSGCVRCIAFLHSQLDCVFGSSHLIVSCWNAVGWRKSSTGSADSA